MYLIIAKSSCDVLLLKYSETYENIFKGIFLVEKKNNHHHIRKNSIAWFTLAYHSTAQNKVRFLEKCNWNWNTNEIIVIHNIKRPCYTIIYLRESINLKPYLSEKKLFVMFLDRNICGSLKGLCKIVEAIKT